MTRTRVLFDATSIPRERAGVGRYVEGVLAAIAALRSTEVEVLVVAKPDDVGGFRAMGLETVASPAATASTLRRLLWEQTGLPRLARSLGAHVVHSPHYTFPLRGSFRRVVTIHDLTFFTMPQVHTRVKGPMFRWWIRRVAATRRRAIAVSQATADEFVRLAGADPSTITVAHHGFDREVFHPPTDAEVTDFSVAHGVEPDGWIAFLGTLEPRKNLPALIDAYTSVAGAGVPPLLIAGQEGWDATIDASVAAARARGADIRTLGYLPAHHLRAFLGGARIVVYPSLGEGFGLPVLEAMASGACVLTTRELSLPEVGGDAVAYSGTDAAAIATGLRDLLADDAARTRLRTAGLARAAEFTWAASAAAHLDAYVSA